MCVCVCILASFHALMYKYLVWIQGHTHYTFLPAVASFWQRRRESAPSEAGRVSWGTDGGRSPPAERDAGGWGPGGQSTKYKVHDGEDDDIIVIPHTSIVASSAFEWCFRNSCRRALMEE